MAVAKENLQYDFSLFEPKEEQVEEQQKTPAKKARVRRPRSAVKPLTAVKWTAVSLLVMMTLTAVMYGNVQIASLDKQITEAQTKFTSSQAEGVRLNMQLESRSSLDKVENYAVSKLGLQKIESYQIDYIHLDDRDKVVISKKSSNIFANALNVILEYL